MLKLQITAQPLQLVFHLIHKASKDSRNDLGHVRTSGGHVYLYINIKSKDGLFGWVRVWVNATDCRELLFPDCSHRL